MRATARPPEGGTRRRPGFAQPGRSDGAKQCFAKPLPHPLGRVEQGFRGALHCACGTGWLCKANPPSRSNRRVVK